MAFDGFIRLPDDAASLGKRLATRIATGQGPGGEDVHLEANLHIPENPVGYIIASQPLGAIPFASLTTVFSADIALEKLVVANTTTGVLTLTVEDGVGNALYKDVPFPPNATVILNFDGLELTGGLKWKASATGLNGAVKGYTAT